MNRFTITRSGTRRASNQAPAGGWAIALAFATNGVMTGTWVSRLPAISERLHVSDSTLGLALLGAAIGAVVSLFAASAACRRFGVRPVYTLAVTMWAALYIVAVLAPGPLSLFLTLSIIGFTNGVFGVVVNASAHSLELRYARPLMPLYHGMFSVGALGGSLVGARVAALVGPIPHVIGMALLCTVAAFTAARHIPTDGVVGPPRPRRTAGTSARTLATRIAVLRQPDSIAIAGIGLIAMCATIAEGAANNWSAIFLHHDRGTSESFAAAGFAVYAGAMAIGRVGGNHLARRISRTTLLRTSGTLLCLAIITLVSTQSIVLAVLAMVFWGLGVAVIFPSAMSAAAEVLDEPTVGISRVSMIGFSGFIVGPPLIGWLATTINLGAALVVVAIVGLVLIALAPFATRHRLRADFHPHSGFGAREELSAECSLLQAADA